MNLDSIRLHIERTEREVSRLKQEKTQFVLGKIACEMRIRFPKRHIVMMFAMGADLIIIGDEIYHEGETRSKPLQQYFDIFQMLNDELWNNQGIYSNDIIIEPYLKPLRQL